MSSQQLRTFEAMVMDDAVTDEQVKEAFVRLDLPKEELAKAKKTFSNWRPLLYQYMDGRWPLFTSRVPGY